MSARQLRAMLMATPAHRALWSDLSSSNPPSTIYNLSHIAADVRCIPQTLLHCNNVDSVDVADLTAATVNTRLIQGAAA